MREKHFLRMVRELMECARAFERYPARHLRELGLSPAPFANTSNNLFGLELYYQNPGHDKGVV